ncbi:phage tail assembly protein [Sphingomonas sp. 8AM]|uniref:phage tail assembly protein n=1 Tax=Sphingomonas sp. 8AM TaxID=2653170 RepID=UPI0012F38EA2|nr:phage tail assembly protein [Sphingomonas sp. 8AM]VXC79907.1 Phage tail assembly protein [Sphingomonas sp. 8AM]
MTEQIAVAAASTIAIAIASFTLDGPVTLNGAEVIAAGTEIHVRKPMSGELRGLTINALLNCDVAALLTIAPRITSPVIPKGATMDPADLTQLGGEVMDFLLPKAAKAALPTT